MISVTHLKDLSTGVLSRNRKKSTAIAYKETVKDSTGCLFIKKYWGRKCRSALGGRDSSLLYMLVNYDRQEQKELCA